MAPNLWLYQLLLAALVLLCLIIHVWWPDPLRATPPRPLTPDKPRRKRSKEPRLILDSRVLCDQQLNERMQQRFAPFSDIVHKLEETEVEREFLL